MKTVLLSIACGLVCLGFAGAQLNTAAGIAQFHAEHMRLMQGQAQMEVRQGVFEQRLDEHELQQREFPAKFAALEVEVRTMRTGLSWLLGVSFSVMASIVAFFLRWLASSKQIVRRLDMLLPDAELEPGGAE